jgi:hypothetical protein
MIDDYDYIYDDFERFEDAHFLIILNILISILKSFKTFRYTAAA